ncbi:MAG: hypothetical protein ACTSUN_01850 [Promethearchaeota archaeon]
MREKLVFTNFILLEEIIERLPDERFYNKMLKLEMTFNEEPYLAGASAHLQIIGMKLSS